MVLETLRVLAAPLCCSVICALHSSAVGTDASARRTAAMAPRSAAGSRPEMSSSVSSRRVIKASFAVRPYWALTEKALAFPGGLVGLSPGPLTASLTKDSNWVSCWALAGREMGGRFDHVLPGPPRLLLRRCPFT